MRLDPTLIVITDHAILADGSNLPMSDAVRAAAVGGATIIQYRDKNLEGTAFLRVANELCSALKGSGCAFTVNDRLDVALECGAEGVHLGQEDLPLFHAKRLAGSRLAFGVSAGRIEWAVQAALEGADYIGVGPIYPTGTKENARAPIGPQGLTEVLAHADGVPVVAIGGLNAENLPPVIAAGAYGVAVVGAVMGAQDIEAATRDIRNRIEEARA